MTASVIFAIIVISAILYIVLPIDMIRDRTSQEINEAGENILSSFSDLSDGVQQVLDDNLEDSIVQDIFSLPISEHTVSDIVVKRITAEEVSAHWQVPEGDDPVQRYRLFVYGEDSCGGSILTTSETDTETATVLLPDTSRSIGVQAVYESELSLPVCAPIPDIPESTQTPPQ